MKVLYYKKCSRNVNTKQEATTPPLDGIICAAVGITVSWCSVPGSNSAALTLGRSYPYQQPASAKAATSGQATVNTGYDAGALGTVYNYAAVSR